MWRVTALIKRKHELSRQAFAQGWQDQIAPAIAAAVSADARVRRVVLDIPPVELDEVVAQIFPPPFDGMLEFWFDDAEAAVGVMRNVAGDEQLRPTTADIVDVEKGVAWLAKVVPSKAEQGTRIKFTAAGEVSDSMTVEEAQRYWAEVHPRVAQTAPAVWNPLTRYTQFHGVRTPELNLGHWLATARFVPMCSDMGFAQQRDFVGVYTSDDYVRIVRPDELKFGKPGEMLSFITAEERVLVG